MHKIMRSKKKLTAAVLTATMTTIFAAGMVGAADFDQTITGAAGNAPYAADGIFDNGTYKFTEDTTITAKSAVNVDKTTTIDATGHTLTFNGTVVAGGGLDFAIKADKINVNVTADGDRTDPVKMGSWKNGRTNLAIDGDMTINFDGDDVGMLYLYTTDYVHNGNLKISNKTTYKGTGYRWDNIMALYVAGGFNGAHGSNMTVNGNTEIDSVGIGVTLNVADSVLNLTNGDVTIKTPANPDANFGAVVVNSGQANINATRDKDGGLEALPVAGDHTVKIEGDILADAQQSNPKDVHGIYSGINIGLTNADSYLKGVIWNTFVDEENGITVGPLKVKGATSLVLQNGGIWYNELQQTEKKLMTPYEGLVDFEGTGSVVNVLLGGDDVKTAGFIYQKNEEPITVKHLKGEVVAFFDRDEAKPTDVKGGELIVEKVIGEGAVHVRTDSAGLSLGDPESAATKETVKKVLGNLADKLIFTAAADGGTGLSGYAEIAEGLTSSSALQFHSKLNFTATEGRGEITDIEVVVPDESEVPVAFGSEETTTMRGVREAMMLPILNFRSSMNDLSKRLGDVRYGDIDKGVWALVEHGKSEYKAEGINDSMNYTSLQTGYDRELDNGWVVGGMFQYVNGDPKGDFINGTVKNFALGAYGTKVNADGSYMDVVGKFGRISNDYTVVNKDNIKVDADYHANAGMISMEYGKRFADDRGFYVEPQGELSYGRVAGHNYDANTTFAGNTKLHVDQDAYDSLVGRLGVAVGYATDKGSAFAKLSVSHEFAGDMDITYAATNQPTKTTHVDGKDTWTTFQLGGTYQTAENMYVYGNALTTFGGDYKEKYKLNLGVRFQF